ncbi:glycosyltransferase [soil metagenome]
MATSSGSQLKPSSRRNFTSASVLVVHNRYQRRGGENTVVNAELTLLRDHGNRLEYLEFSNDGLTERLNAIAKFGAAVGSVWSRDSAKRTRIASGRFRPDVIHVHNTFPTASPSVYSAARSTGAAVVQTLHNYRLLCPNALFFRDGHVCEDCLGKFVPWPGVVHACYRDSRAATGVTAAMLTVHRARKTLIIEVDLVIALTEFSRQKFIEGGLPDDRIVVKPNFIDRPYPPQRRDDDYFLFVGRLVDYKGASLLPSAWRLIDDRPMLRIAGDGPQREEIASVVIRFPQITLLGSIGAEEVQYQMLGARALVVPSQLYETFGLIIIEAFASGLPVIASRLGAMAEIVDDGRTGLLFEPGNAADLGAKVRWAADHPHEMAQMGANARAEYEAKYTAEINYAQLIAVYDQAIEIRKSRPS